MSRKCFYFLFFIELHVPFLFLFLFFDNWGGNLYLGEREGGGGTVYVVASLAKTEKPE